MTSDVKTTKANKWVSHIRDYSVKNGMSYRQAMRDEGCKSAYKSPEPERSPSPIRPPSPEPEAETKPKKGRKKALPDLMLVPVLMRSEPEPAPQLIPAVIKKDRVKRVPRMVPT